MKQAADKQDHKRIVALLENVGIPARGRTALLAGENVSCPDGVTRQLFETSSKESIRSYLSGRRTVPFQVKENLRAWLRTRFGYSSPKDLFSKDFEDQREFLEYAEIGSEKLVFDAPRFESSEFQFLEYHIDALRFGLERGGQTYLSDARFEDAAIHVREIGSFMAGASSLPNELVSKFGQIFRLIESCGGCGKGIDELIELDPVFRSAWERRDEIYASLEEREQFLGLANIVAKWNHLTRLKGERILAYESASFVHTAATQGHLGPKASADRLELETRTRESLVGFVGFGDMVETVGEYYGEHSKEFLGVLQCAACQAVFNEGSGEEGFSTARDKIERAKQAISHAKAVASQTGAEDLSRIIGRKDDIEFIHVSYIERKFWKDASRLDAELRRYGIDNLLALRKVTTAPLRRAKVNYWLWRAEGRTQIQRLKEALDLLDERKEVVSVCVLDVPGFRHELEQALASGMH